MTAILVLLVILGWTFAFYYKIDRDFLADTEYRRGYNAGMKNTRNYMRSIEYQRNAHTQQQSG